MIRITETELLDRHKQSLGEARDACQRLGRNADPEHLSPRGFQYANLKKALEMLEGSCRQMATLRADARWIRLGTIYARAMHKARSLYEAGSWNAFNQLMGLFELGQRRLDELEVRTGTTGPILPQNPSSWIIMPETKPHPGLIRETRH